MENITQKLEEHRLLAISLKSIKAKELKLRNEITDHLLEGKGNGTHNFSIDGMNVKVVSKITYTIEQSLLTDVMDDLNEEQLDMIQTKYTLKLKQYKAGTPGIINDILITKPALPSLSVELGE